MTCLNNYLNHLLYEQLLGLTGQVSELVITESNFDRLNELLDDVT